jgi:hypothetical protein
MKKITNGLAYATVFCLLLTTVITAGITVTSGLQLITAPTGSIGNNFIRNVSATVDHNVKRAAKTATIGKRG